MFKQTAAAFVASVVLLPGVAFTQTPPNPTQQPIVASQGDVPLFRITVIGRTTPAINYRPRRGDTKVDLQGTALMPQARGEAKVSGEQGYMNVEARFDKFGSASAFGPEYLTQDWTDINQQLYSALMLEKIGMGIGIGLIVMVAALNIIASLILLVMEKTRDSAIQLADFQGSLSERGNVVLAAMAEGQITADETATVMQALSAQARVVQGDELERRVSALESSRIAESM